VAALGAGVAHVAIGDEVYGLNDWYRDGAQAEFCVARAGEVAPRPRSVDHAHAAVTPISGLTAWQALIERARLAAAERVLIHAGAGAVGTFAVQLARWRGARVLATAATSNLDFVRELGADEVIDYARALRGGGAWGRRGAGHRGGRDAGAVVERARSRRTAGHDRRRQRDDDRPAGARRVLHRACRSCPARRGGEARRRRLAAAGGGEDAAACRGTRSVRAAIAGQHARQDRSPHRGVSSAVARSRQAPRLRDWSGAASATPLSRRLP